MTAPCPHTPVEKDVERFLWLGPFPPAPGKPFPPKYLYKLSCFYLFQRCRLLWSPSTVADTTRLETQCDLWYPSVTEPNVMIISRTYN